MEHRFKLKTENRGKNKYFLFSKNGEIIIENTRIYPPPNMYIFFISIFSITLLLSNIFIYIDFAYAP